MARGVPRPDLREQLFAAADRILARDGAAGLSSRALTDEAHCAKGLLHNHFDGLDGFLTEFAVDRLQRAMAQLSDLPARAGDGVVVDNLTDASVRLFGSGAITVAALMAARPGLAARIAPAVESAGVSLRAGEATFADYLAAERDLGRIPAATDTEAVAFTLVSAVHHLFFGSNGRDLDPARVQRIVSALVPAA